MATGFPIIFGAGGLWTPALTTTLLWLDASDPSTIILNGSTVSQWSDKSGNARHFTQTTASSQPVYSTNQLNGNPILQFDGVDDFLDGGNILPATNGLTTFFVARQNTISSTSLAPYFGRASSTPTNGEWYNRGMVTVQATAASIAVLRTASGSYSSSSIAAVDSNWYLLGFRYSSIANQLQAMRNSASAAIAVTAGVAADPALACRIAAFAGGTISYLHMDISEIVVVASGLTGGDPIRQRIEGYLSWKYGLQGNLPSTHPYKNAPPTL